MAKEHKFRTVKQFKMVWSSAWGKMVKRPVKFSKIVPLKKARERKKIRKVA
jgi:hypothetical protein